MRIRRSNQITLVATSRPPIIPIRTAAEGLTNAHGAVIETRPPSSPLQVMPTSGLRDRYQTAPSAATAPDAEASMVFAATRAMRASVAASVEPALNPNHPKAG